MKKYFVPYQQALELKELGFKEECISFYCKDEEKLFYNQHPEIKPVTSRTFINAPLYQQAFRWFRKEHIFSGEVYSSDFGGAIEYSFLIRNLYTEKLEYDNFQGSAGGYFGVFDTYEEAELACLKKLIEIVR
jgi:hypothetical protein